MKIKTLPLLLTLALLTAHSAAALTGKNPTFLYVALVVEVYEASTGRLVWLGQATDVPPDKPRKAKSIVRKVVKKMFKSFPEVKAPEGETR